MNKIIRNITLIASAALFVRHFVQLTKVSGNSMFPELHSKDRLLIDKTAYAHKDPEAGDVVVFSEPNGDKMLIKRIIGVPGDHVVIRNGEVKINGVVANDDYTADGATDGNVDLVVPKGRYFILGDNRLHSKDSRAPMVGCVPKESIMGKVNIRVYPPGRVFSREVVPQETADEKPVETAESLGTSAEHSSASVEPLGSAEPLGTSVEPSSTSAELGGAEQE